MQRKGKDERNLIGDVHPRRINQADSLNAEALQPCQPVGQGAEINPKPPHAKERYNTKNACEQRGRDVYERHRLSAIRCAEMPRRNTQLGASHRVGLLRHTAAQSSRLVSRGPSQLPTRLH